MSDIRAARTVDEAAIWRILQPAIADGETLALPREWDRRSALDYWFQDSHRVFIAEQRGKPVGTYYLRPNALGGGQHVGNCGYVTDEAARGQGVARSMCMHSLQIAREIGFKALQFNFVVSSNTVAIALWKSLGFETVATIPAAFDHPRYGHVAALVMHRPI